MAGPNVTMCSRGEGWVCAGISGGGLPLIFVFCMGASGCKHSECWEGGSQEILEAEKEERKKKREEEARKKEEEEAARKAEEEAAAAAAAAEAATADGEAGGEATVPVPQENGNAEKRCELPPAKVLLVKQ